MSEIEPNIRRFMSSWQLWMGVAWLAIVVIVVGLVIVRNETITNAARINQEQALHRSEVESTAESAYNSCLESIPVLRRISIHLSGVNEVATALTLNAKALLDATPRADPTYEIRLANYRRIRRAEIRVAAIRELPVPTSSECKSRKTDVLNRGGIR